MKEPSTEYLFQEMSEILMSIKKFNLGETIELSHKSIPMFKKVQRMHKKEILQSFFYAYSIEKKEISNEDKVREAEKYYQETFKNSI